MKTSASPLDRPPVRTIVIDPYPLSRFGLAALLDQAAEFTVVRTVASAATLPRAPRADLVVVQTDGGSTDHHRLPHPVVEVGLGDAPHRILASLRRAIGISTTRTPQSPHRLTRREFDVIALVAAGHTDHEIADALYLSVRTVRSHLDRIRAKTGQRRRAELTRWYLETKGAENL